VAEPTTRLASPFWRLAAAGVAISPVAGHKESVLAATTKN
jgi:hypothetical protein